MKWLLAAFLIAGPGFAEVYLGDDLIDFERLLRENADKVVKTTDRAGNPARSLDLGDGQSIICSDMGCTGEGSNSGLGCDWEMLTIVRGMAVACSAPPSEGLTALEALHARLSAHVAANAFPPREPGEIEARYQRVIKEFKKGTDAVQRKTCEEVLPASGMIGSTLEILSDPEAAAEIEGRLLSPGLPFIDPCL